MTPPPLPAATEPLLPWTRGDDLPAVLAKEVSEDYWRILFNDPAWTRT